MAVYERRYRPFEGELTPQSTRFAVLPQYAWGDVFRSKLFLGLLCLAGLWPLVLTILIYIPHNLGFLKQIEKLGTDPDMFVQQFLTFDAAFFYNWFFFPYLFVAVLIALIVGPPLVSADLRNNALPLYFSRPFARYEYVLGKSTILVCLLSLVTWIPGCWLFLFQSYLQGFKWFAENIRIGLAMFSSYALWVAILCLFSLAISAYVKFKPAARLALLGLFAVGWAVEQLVWGTLRTTWGALLNPAEMMGVASRGIFGVGGETVPTFAAWISLLCFCLVALLVLSRRLRAYEVVRS